MCEENVHAFYTWLHHMTFSQHLETWHLETFLDNDGSFYLFI